MSADTSHLRAITLLTRPDLSSSLKYLSSEATILDTCWTVCDYQDYAADVNPTAEGPEEYPRGGENTD